MITSETPYKLAEIIRDTWPGLFYRTPNKLAQDSLAHHEDSPYTMDNRESKHD
jgi:hypothetical protein